MSYASDRLREFHEAFEVKGQADGLDLFTICQQRHTLHEEEHGELDEALGAVWVINERQGKEELVEELADEMVLLYGTADLLGLDLDIAFRLKMDGNMAKLPDCPNPRCDDGDVPGGLKGHLLCPDCGGSGKGKPLKREDGKILKSEHWQKPSMAEAIK